MLKYGLILLAAMLFGIMGFAAFAQDTKQASPIPDPPKLDLQIIRQLLLDKDEQINDKSTQVLLLQAQVSQLKQVILAKQSENDELKKKTMDKQ